MLYITLLFQSIHSYSQNTDLALMLRNVKFRGGFPIVQPTAAGSSVPPRDTACVQPTAPARIQLVSWPGKKFLAIP